MGGWTPGPGTLAQSLGLIRHSLISTADTLGTQCNSVPLNHFSPLPPWVFFPGSFLPAQLTHMYAAHLCEGIRELALPQWLASEAQPILEEGGGQTPALCP